MLRMMSELGSSTCYRHDTIDSMSVKIAAVELHKPIKHVVNLSLRHNKFANCWKIARLIPLHKGKGHDENSPGSYRPILLLATVSKLTEKAAQSQILKFFEQHNLLNHNSHAYRAVHSTTTAMMQLTDQIAEGNDKNLITMSMGIDQTSAFDCVQHNILTAKFKLYKLSQRTTDWINSYLRGRSQYVCIDTKNSTMTSLIQGVPQGSVLGPLLYSIYVNELPQIVREQDNCRNCQNLDNDTSYLFKENCPQCGTVTCFADDSTLTISRKTRTDNQKCITDKLTKMTEFLNSNQLTVNLPKTVLIETMTHQKRPRIKDVQPKLTVRKPNGEIKTILPAKHVKLLGGYLQENSNWEAHLEGAEKALLPDIRRKIGAIKHLGVNIPRATKLRLANAFVISKILYLLPVWGGPQINTSTGCKH